MYVVHWDYSALYGHRDWLRKISYLLSYVRLRGQFLNEMKFVNSWQLDNEIEALIDIEKICIRNGDNGHD